MFYYLKILLTLFRYSDRIRKHTLLPETIQRALINLREESNKMHFALYHEFRPTSIHVAITFQLQGYF